MHVTTDAGIDPPLGELRLSSRIVGQGTALHCILSGPRGPEDEPPLRDETLEFAASESAADPALVEVVWRDLDVDLWWPNGYGDQPRYALVVELLDAAGDVLDRAERTVGFRHIAWQPCMDAPEDADPWLCVVNGQPIFLQGVNWTPIRPNFADVGAAAYEKRLKLYRDLHVNVLRVWGGAVLEREVFYDLCDALGLSGLAGVPPLVLRGRQLRARRCGTVSPR